MKYFSIQRNLLNKGRRYPLVKTAVVMSPFSNFLDENFERDLESLSKQKVFFLFI